jgi:putative hydrolase of the HAD superfamily
MKSVDIRPELDALIFDMGNVLIDWTPSRLVRHFTTDESIVDQVTEALFHSVAWKELDQGLISEEATIERVCATLPKALHPLIHAIVTCWPEANVIDPRMEQLARVLRGQGIRLFLGSNASLRFWSYQSDIKALAYFDGIQISADIRVSKPDPRFFEVLLESHGLDPNRTGFIDDLERNCASAKSVGLAVFHYTKDFNALVRWLIDQRVMSVQSAVEELGFLG